MEVQLYPKQRTLSIQQKTTIFNTSNDTITKVYLHDWANAYRDKKTPLARRFTDHFSKVFHFASEEERGHTDIQSLRVDAKNAKWERLKGHPDIIVIYLQNAVAPNESIAINNTYKVKIPNAKFTKYGEENGTYHLKYWYLTPAVISDKKQQPNNLMSNLDIGDLYADFSNYYISFKVPKKYHLVSDLEQVERNETTYKKYTLIGVKHPVVTLSISPKNEFSIYQNKKVAILSDIKQSKISKEEKEKILGQQLAFLNNYFNAYPHSNILLREVDYQKNPIYGLSQLPVLRKLFDKGFDWELKMFSVLSQKYVDAIFNLNVRKDYAISMGISTYLLLKYIQQYYPNEMFIGKASKLPILKRYELAKMKFSDRYAYFYNLAKQHQYSQPFTIPLDSLSNFNQKIISRYKSALYMDMLDKNLGEGSMMEAIVSFSKKYYQKKTNGASLLKELEEQCETDISWFRDDFIKEEKDIDYRFEDIKKTKDSLQLSIETNVLTKTPFTVSGLKNGQVTYEKKVYPKGNSTKLALKIPNYDFDKIAVNSNVIVPETNLKNNWVNMNGLLKKPIQLRFIDDIQNPKYYQIKYTPEVGYNFYDGIILGMAISNKNEGWDNFTYKITPSYGFKSNRISGSYNFEYKNRFAFKNHHTWGVGISGSHFEYAPNLKYNALLPYAYLSFRPKNLRYPAYKTLLARLTYIEKEKPQNAINKNKIYNYNVFNLKYNYHKLGVLKSSKFSTEWQLSSDFSKVSTTASYRWLTNGNRYFSVRFFAGAFLYNKTKNDFFSFALERPTDYLFQYNYLGRSESSGILSQQIVISEGGFTTKLPVPFANQWITTANFSTSIWRWIQAYTNIGWVKNKGIPPYFAHESGIRLNFVPDILEIYFPIHSNLGWQVAQKGYNTRIRFVLDLDVKSIYNHLRQGFY
ncbi:MAG: hypothetical protein KGV44_10345 [Flavobacteriaceae bacterium]|nr:hypothetical protein [Flavobacteriaceae bacterium]